MATNRSLDAWFVLVGAVALAFVACSGDDSPDALPAVTDGAAGDGGGTERGGAPAAAQGGSDSGGDGGERADAGASGSGGEAASNQVTGTVVDRNLRPVEGLVVSIGAATATTDEHGRFAVDSIEARYDCTIKVSEPPTAYVFKGLTRRDPTLQLHLLLGSVAEHSASVNLTLTLDGDAYEATDARAVLSIEPQRQFLSSLDPVTTTLELSPAWSGEAITYGHLGALLFNATGGVPEEYLGFGSTSVPLADNATSDVSLDLQSVAEHTLTATETLPEGFEALVQQGFVRAPSAAAIQVLSDATPEAEITLVTPGISDASILLRSIAADGELVSQAFATSDTDATDVELVHRRPSNVLSPADHAEGVTRETPFEVTAAGEAVYSIQLIPLAEGKPHYVIVTSDTSLTIPELSELGLTWPAQTPYVWTVLTFAPFSDMDAATSGGGFAATLAFSNGNLAAPITSGATLGSGATFSFTTAP